MASDYIRTPYANDNRTLLDLMRLASADRSRSDVQKAAIRSNGILNIGQLIAGTLASIREDKTAQQALALKAQQIEDERRQRNNEMGLRQMEMGARMGDRQDAIAAREEAAADRRRAEGYKIGADVAEEVQQGPMSEMQLDQVMQGPAAGRARYSFGPGTADGPELQPTKAMQESASMREQLSKMGYQFGPNGQVIPPKPAPAPERPVNVPDGGRLVMPSTGKVVYTAPAKANAGSDDVTALSPAGLDAAALNYAKTGVMPALGMGDKNTRKHIINRAAEMMPGLDIASAKADFGANSASLTALQKQRDALGAFEETAIKNLDVFLDAAKGIKDTGSPLLNQPIRMLDERVLGSAEQTAFNTARRTVIPEFAKILANPGLSGQLSDSARHEVEEVISGNASIKQIIAAANVLKRDTANRRTSYDDQIAGIRARLSKAQTPAAPKADDPVDALIKKYGGGD